MLTSISRETLSNFTGTGSLVVWIFAQSPQIYQNYVSKSVEGLSFVFLLQWTIGDLTNFIGAFLTKQLPIQIIIAAYMLTVDLILCAQYALYYRKEPEKRKTYDFMHEQTPLILAPHRHVHRRHPTSSGTRGVSLDRHVGLYRTNSSDPWYVYRLNTPRKKGRRSQTVDRAQRGLSRSQESTQPASQSSRTFSPANLQRGRGRESRAHQNTHASKSTSMETHSQKRKRLKVQPSMSRRGTSMVLMGTWFMMTMGPWSWHKDSVQNDVSVSPTPVTLATQHYTIHQNASLAVSDQSMSLQDSLRHPILLFMPMVELAKYRHERKKVPLSVLVGRIFAWFCTVLYMTSRLPQIWANYKRKSVHGLSWLLFLLAFLANLLYSISILTNPKAVGPTSRQFLSESLPFLIGSGGTLVFDLVILIQYWMWHDRSTRNDSHGSA